MVSTRRSAAKSAPQVSTPGSSAAQQQPALSQQRQESTAETATVVPSAQSQPNLSDEEIEELVVVTSQQDNNNSTAPTQQQQPQQQVPAALDVRIPETQDVIKQLRKTDAVKKILKSNIYITTEEEQEIFFQVSLWEEFSTKLYTAIKRCVPKSTRYINSATKKYVTAKDEVIDWVSNYELLPASVPEEKRDEASMVIHLLGFEFSGLFHKLITPPSGKERVPIDKQIADVLQNSKKVALKDYFEKGVAKHVYYVIGWLCKAGSEEAKRRTKTNDIGRCISSLENHFTNDATEVAALKADLPKGVTDLVDKRSHFGGLKYPNLQLYTVFARVERIYSLLSTPTNFIIFGEELLALICSGIIENQTMMDEFKGILSCDVFDDETILAAVAYYMKTFGNMRLKDLCFRYNSNLHEGPEAGIRQKLVGAKRKSAPAKKKSTKKKTAKKKTAKKKTAKKKTAKKKSQQCDDESPPEEADEGEDEEEPPPDDEEGGEEAVGDGADVDVDDEAQHQEMFEAAEEEETAEDEMKECTIHQRAANHMEE